MRLRILQWNVWYKEDIRNILKFVKSTNPDLFCAQELTIGYKNQVLNDTVKYLASKLEMHSSHTEMLVDDVIVCNGVFSKYPILSNQVHEINKPIGTGGYDDELRTMLVAEIELADSNTFWLATTHMSYTHKFEPTKRKLKETENLIKSLEKRDSKFTLSGDFNALPKSTVIKLIEERFINLGPDYSINSWTTKPFSYNGFEENELNWRLDYIFGTKDIRVINAEIIQTEFSDHLPLLIEIEI